MDTRVADRDTTGRPARRSTSRSGLQALVLALPLLVLAVAAWAHRNVIDDGFIYLRIVHQVLAGHGPVFNKGERVEAFTSPLWVGILAVADALTPFRLEWLAVVLGIAATLAGVVLAVVGSARLCRLDANKAFLVPFGVVVLVVLSPMWFYASSGLETGIVFLWLGLSLWLLVNWSRSSERLPWWAAIVLGLGWLVRPELAMYTVAFLLTVLCLQRATWAGRLRLLAIALALPAAYQLFRMGYYGSLVANTAVAKEATRMRWVRGWRYFADFTSTYWLVVPLVVLAVGGWAPLLFGLRSDGHDRGVWTVTAFVAAGLLNIVYVIAIGGDYEHARLFVPAVFALCAPIAVIPATRAHVAAFSLAPWAFLAVVSFRPPTTKVGVNFALPQAGRVTTNDLGWGPGSPQAKAIAGANLIYQTKFSDFRGSSLPLASGVHRPVAVIAGIGVMPYSLGNDLSVVDLFGLADPVTARFKEPLRTGVLPYPGHEKQMPRPWIAARLVPPGTSVDPDQLPEIPNPYLPATTGAAFQRQVADARAALQCAPIKRLEHSAEAPLTVGRFLRNIVDSFSNTQLRISTDPAVARRELCGGPSPVSLRAPLPPMAPIRTNARVTSSGQVGPVALVVRDSASRCGRRTARSTVAGARRLRIRLAVRGGEVVPAAGEGGHG